MPLQILEGGDVPQLWQLERGGYGETACRRCRDDAAECLLLCDSSLRKFTKKHSYDTAIQMQCKELHVRLMCMGRRVGQRLPTLTLADVVLEYGKELEEEEQDR